MEISARSFLTAGMSLTAATAIAFAPLPIPASPPTVTIPTVSVSNVRLAALPEDIEAVIAGLQTVFDEASVTAAGVAGLPGRGLIGIAGDIETFFDVALTGLIDATTDPTAAASLIILRTLAVDAWAKLEENLGLINPEITGATEQVGKLLTSALTGSLQNILIAVANVVTHPLSLPNYIGVFNAGLASGQRVIGNGLRAIQTVGDAGFDVAGIAVRELTFQFTNLIGGASALLTQLGDASGSPIVEAVLGVVRDFMLAPVRAVINLGSGLIQAGLTTVNAGFDLVLDSATNIVDPLGEEPESVAPVVAAVRDEEVVSVDKPESARAVEEVSITESTDDVVEQDVADEEAPAEEAPAEEEAVDEVPADEEPAEEEAPAEDSAPAEDDSPSESASAAAA